MKSAPMLHAGPHATVSHRHPDAHAPVARAFDAMLANVTTAQQLARTIAATVMELAFPVDRQAPDGGIANSLKGAAPPEDSPHPDHHAASRDEKPQVEDATSALLMAGCTVPPPITTVVERVVELACAHAASAARAAEQPPSVATLDGSLDLAMARDADATAHHAEPRALEVSGTSRVHMHRQLATLHVAMPGEIGLDVRLRLQGNNIFLDVTGPRATELAAASPQLASALAARGLNLQTVQFSSGAAPAGNRKNPHGDSEETAHSLRNHFPRNPRHVRA